VRRVEISDVSAYEAGQGVAPGVAAATDGVGEGTLEGVQEQGTVTAGAYSAARGPGGR
jgi:hypothetical protein